MSKASSPAAHTPESSPAPAQLLPETPAESATEKYSRPAASVSEISSPVEPFPELDLEVGAEPNPSPTFSHEADMHILPAALSLPAPALCRMREAKAGPVVIARVKWEEGQRSEDERGDMKEATARALLWAKKMFGKDAERRLEDEEEPGHSITEG
ncbi:hypothetical protein MBLNU13_g04277t1 [Cladosporium sp. NU13]